MPKWNAGQPGEFEMPNRCPVCHHLVIITGPNLFSSFPERFEAELAFQCPNPDCRRLFIAKYILSTSESPRLTKLLPQQPGPREELPQLIEKISPTFSSIYKESQEAKEMGLSQICGPGYRKAFEFLVKDYAKTKISIDDEKKAAEEKEKIDGAFSGTVVKNYIADARIQAVAKRALWLANDETHYLRSWTEHNIEDLINLIKLTIHWIEIEHLSEDYIEDMPES